MVRVCQLGDEWRWCPVGKWALEGAILAKRYEGVSGAFVRGAVKAD